jgi:DNA-binding PadR family transcriptional regulator
VYPDNTLTPKEATRLCMLGLLAFGPQTYGDVARSVRAFTGALIGPSLDVMASAIELLRLEDLVEVVDDTGDRDTTLLGITDAGQRELQVLMKTPIRESGSEHNRLIVALKIRFLHVLPVEERREQIETMIDAADAEIGRLSKLEETHAGESDMFRAWVSQERASIETRSAWLEAIHSAI